MKRPVIRTNKILQQESQKLKQKLEALKKQVELKKKEKELTKQTMATEQGRDKDILGGSRDSRKRYNIEKQQSLATWLEKFKMEHLVGKLKEKNIYTVQELRNIHSDVVDQWKDIPVGYRIKLKKQLQAHSSPMVAKSVVRSVSPPSRIEQIVTRRKKNRVFQPLRQSEHDSNQQQLSEYQQQQMIQQLMTAFNKEQQIQQIQFMPLNKTQVVEQSQEIEEKREGMLDCKYCWGCLKRVEREGIEQLNNRVFCREECFLQYQTALNIQKDDDFFQQIEKTEEMFRSYLQMRISPRKSKQTVKIISEIDDIQVDFNIE